MCVCQVNFVNFFIYLSVYAVTVAVAASDSVGVVVSGVVAVIVETVSLASLNLY